MALGERIRGLDARVHCLVSDGELQEGQVWEAAMAAGHHRLDNLVVLVDNNRMQADGATAEVLDVAPVPKKLEAFGFVTRRLDAHSLDEILAAFDVARVTREADRPRLRDRPGQGRSQLRGLREGALRPRRPGRLGAALEELGVDGRARRTPDCPAEQDHLRRPELPRPRGGAGLALPERPLLFAKWPNALIGPGQAIVLPPLSSQVDYEAELAAVIGERVRGERGARVEVVAGFICLNDVTARDLQFTDGQWTRSKSFDTFCPVGLEFVLAVAERSPVAADPCLLNGEVLQDSSTANMVFSVAELIAFASEAIELEPGDLIATGTPAGVGYTREPPRFLRPGDEVTVEIDGRHAHEPRAPDHGVPPFDDL